MSEGLRIFFVDETGLPSEIPRRCYDDLLERRPEEGFPERAGTLVRCAAVRVTETDTGDLLVLGMHCFLLPLDREGRLDVAALEKDLKPALDKGRPLEGAGPGGRILDARERFAKKRYDRKYRWSLTPEIRAAIEAAVRRNPPPS